MARVRPDPDLVVTMALRSHLPGGPLVVALRPDDFLDRLPVVVARTITADAGQMLSHVTYAEVDVQSWASTRQAASDLDDACLQALRAARGEAFAGGRIARIEPQALGTEVREADQAGRVYRWQASYRLTIRPT